MMRHSILQKDAIAFALYVHKFLMTVYWKKIIQKNMYVLMDTIGNRGDLIPPLLTVILPPSVKQVSVP